MIRKLTSQDDSQCQSLIQQKPAENLFIIGDIEAFGYEQDFQTIWGDFDESGNLRAVLLKYEQNFIPFSLSQFDYKGFADIMNEDNNFKYFSGLKDITEKIEPYLKRPLQQKRELYYAKCTNDNQLGKGDTSIVQTLTYSDIPDLVQLLKSIPEFKDGQFSAESKRRNMEKGVARSYFIQEDGKMVSTASTTAENSMSAMVVAVGTDTNYKKKGYATKCLIKLCRDLLSEGKELCLFYDNPDAGAIYKRLGFVDIGFWMMYTFED